MQRETLLDEAAAPFTIADWDELLIVRIQKGRFRDGPIPLQIFTQDSFVGVIQLYSAIGTEEEFEAKSLKWSPVAGGNFVEDTLDGLFVSGNYLTAVLVSLSSGNASAHIGL